MTADINKKLAELKKELNDIQFQNPSDKSHIDGLITELENADNDESAIESIKSSIERFETEHPRATAILNDIMVTLSNMGI